MNNGTILVEGQGDLPRDQTLNLVVISNQLSLGGAVAAKPETVPESWWHLSSKRRTKRHPTWASPVKPGSGRLLCAMGIWPPGEARPLWVHGMCGGWRGAAHSLPHTLCFRGAHSHSSPHKGVFGAPAECQALREPPAPGAPRWEGRQAGERARTSRRCECC